MPLCVYNGDNGIIGKYLQSNNLLVKDAGTTKTTSLAIEI